MTPQFFKLQLAQLFSVFQKPQGFADYFTSSLSERKSTLSLNRRLRAKFCYDSTLAEAFPPG
ncbi:MAG: hypothetical protein L0312_13685, partial [Acidobacteria bacterium]|nr:hypothetical protein [Acidobacteriota bacterium]